MDTVLAQVSEAERLGDVLGEPVADVRVGPYQAAGWGATDSAFTSVVATMADGSRRPTVLKTSTWDSDWSRRATSDRIGRAAQIWQHGLLGRVPDEIDHATLAAWADDAGGQSIPMRDAREDLLEEGSTPRATEHVILDAAAAMHAEFFEDPILADPRLGLCSVHDLLRSCAPDMAASQQQHGGSEAMDMLVAGWDLLGELVDPDIRDALWSLASGPPTSRSGRHEGEVGPRVRPGARGDHRVPAADDRQIRVVPPAARGGGSSSARRPRVCHWRLLVDATAQAVLHRAGRAQV